MSRGTLPRLLAGIGERPMATLDSHVAVHGSLPDLGSFSSAGMIELASSAGLRGHGGASFPMAKKMQAVASRRGSKIVVANGSEGEPASKKDRVLMRELPHLVLDGAAAAARAVGAGDAILAVAHTDQRSLHALEVAIGERAAAGLRHEPRFELFEVPERYLSGQEMALMNLLNGGEAKPTFGPRPFERGVRQRPTLVQNVETLAHLALLVRHGPAWFRELGTESHPGSALVTISGALTRPGVYEIEHGTPLADLLDTAGLTDSVEAVLVGGYFGSWLPAASVPAVLLCAEDLSRHDATLGAGVIVALGEEACPVAETTRIADFFAAEAAGQCGPCVNGLDAIADTLQQLASGTAGRSALQDIERWTTELPRRGACQHPDGAVRFIASAMRVFSDAFRDHAHNGRCERCLGSSVLPTPLLAA